MAAIEGYEIEGELGRGGMGVVYRARQVSSGRLVALKVILASSRADARFVERFRREAAAASRVAHENIAAIVEVRLDGPAPFIAFELLEGGSLEEAIRTRGRLPPPEVARIGAAVARALAAIHAAGLVHRDVKPANLLLAADGTPKLSDFGLVRQSTPGVASLTRTGEMVGTLEYLAPEIADGAKSVGPAADLYAFGATLHALLTGHPPFEGHGVELVKKHLLEKPAPPSQSGAGDTPRELDALVLSLLEKEPGDRPASASDVAARLDAIAGAGGHRRRSRAPIAIAAVAIVAAVAAAATIIGRSQPTPTAPPAPSVRPPATTSQTAKPSTPQKIVGLSTRRWIPFSEPCPSLALIEGTHKVVAGSPDGKGIGAIWDLDGESEVPVRRLADGDADEILRSAAVSPNGKRIAISVETRKARGPRPIYLFDGPTTVKHLEGHGNPADGESTIAYGLGFVDDDTLVSGGRDGLVLVWDLRVDRPKGKPVEDENLLANTISSVNTIRRLDADHVAIATDGSFLMFCDVRALKADPRLKAHAPPRDAGQVPRKLQSITVSRDRSLALAGTDEEGKLVSWRTSGRDVRMKDVHAPNRVAAVELIEEPRQVISCGVDGAFATDVNDDGSFGESRRISTDSITDAVLLREKQPGLLASTRTGLKWYDFKVK